MDKSSEKTLIIMSGILLIIIFIFIFTSSLLKESITISSTGNAELKINPDLVKVYFNIDTKADNITEVKEKNFEMYDLLHSLLIESGFTEDKIQTTNLMVDSNYR